MWMNIKWMCGRATPAPAHPLSRWLFSFFFYSFSQLWGSSRHTHTHAFALALAAHVRFSICHLAPTPCGSGAMCEYENKLNNISLVHLAIATVRLFFALSLPLPISLSFFRQRRHWGAVVLLLLTWQKPRSWKALLYSWNICKESDRQREGGSQLFPVRSNQGWRANVEHGARAGILN